MCVYSLKTRKVRPRSSVVKWRLKNVALRAMMVQLVSNSEKRICLIVNPNAGKRRGLAVAGQTASLLDEAGIITDTRISERPGHTREIAEQLDQSEWNGIVAVGGDGTLFEIINGLLTTTESIDVPIGQIPVGTGNSFLKDIEPATPEGTEAPQVGDSVERAVARIVNWSPRRVDLGHFVAEAGSYFFINLLGAGFVSNVAYRAKKYKWLGSLSYILGVIEEVIGLTSTQITLEIDGRGIERDGIFVEICNSRFTGGDMMMAPAAQIDDGFLDVILLTKVSRGTILRLLPTIFKGTHVNEDCVEVYRGKKIIVRSELPLALTPDGETFGETPIEVTVHPHKLEILG